MSKTAMVHVPWAPVPCWPICSADRSRCSRLRAFEQRPHPRRPLRGLAVTTEKRVPALPDLPAIGELLPGYRSDFWFGMWAPKGTPKEIVQRLNHAIVRMLNLPEMLERLRTDGMEPVGSTPDEFARVIARDIATWTRVVRAGDIKID
jgi:tripartite-type tricarboxylate transporter receptor subunit TctC